MPAKGQLMHPKLSLRSAHDRVMNRIDALGVAIGVFFVGGEITCMRRSAPGFSRRAEKLNSQFVGVYDQGADSRVVMADLKTFYPDGFDIEKESK
jgi:hypothetical protein